MFVHYLCLLTQKINKQIFFLSSFLLFFQDVLTIEVDNRYSLLLPLDAKIDEAKTSAEFSARSALLTVKIPLLTQH